MLISTCISSLQISSNEISIKTLDRLIPEDCRIGLWCGDPRPLVLSEERLERRLEGLASWLMSSWPIVLDLNGQEDRRERI